MYKYLLALLIIPAVILFAGIYPKTAAQKPLPPLQQFHFTYHGTMRYALQDYSLEEKEGKYILTLDADNPYQRQEHIVTQKEMDALHALLEQRGVSKWNGFKGNDSRVLDGYTFALSIRFTDNSKLYASGCNAYPAGFRDTQKQLVDFFEAYRVTKENNDEKDS